MNKAYGSDQYPRGVPSNQVDAICPTLELVVLLIKDEDVELKLEVRRVNSYQRFWIGRLYLCGFTNSKGSPHLIKGEHTSLSNFTSMQVFSWGPLNCSFHALL